MFRNRSIIPPRGQLLRKAASGSFDLTFTVNTDKYQLNTLEKVDGAVITVTPSRTGGNVDGGSWQMTPAGATNHYHNRSHTG